MKDCRLKHSVLLQTVELVSYFRGVHSNHCLNKKKKKNTNVLTLATWCDIYIYIRQRNTTFGFGPGSAASLLCDFRQVPSAVWASAVAFAKSVEWTDDL